MTHSLKLRELALGLRSVPDMLVEAAAALDAVERAAPEAKSERERFEADATALGFDVSRRRSNTVEPWSEYNDIYTGYRWAGWLAALSAPAEPQTSWTTVEAAADLARATVDARPAVEAGWQLVPIEPTDEMYDAAWRYVVSADNEVGNIRRRLSIHEFKLIVSAVEKFMLSAAPTPPEPKP